MSVVNANFEKDVDNQGNAILRGKATFKGFAGDNILTTANENQTKYKLGNIEFIGADGKVHQTSGAIYEKVYTKNQLNVDDVVSIVVRSYENKAYVSILGVTGAGTLSIDNGAFGDMFGVAKEADAPAMKA